MLHMHSSETSYSNNSNDLTWT